MRNLGIVGTTVSVPRGGSVKRSQFGLTLTEFLLLVWGEDSSSL